MVELLSFLPKKDKEPRLSDGTRIFIEMIEEADIDGAFRDVDEHEAEHAVVAIRNGTGVVEGSTNPSGNVLGYVLMKRADPVAAATSRDRRGNAGDRALVEATGHDFHSAGSAANSVKARNKKAIRAVAVAFCKHRYLTGRQIQKIIDTVDRGELMRVRIVSPDGRERTLTKRVKHGEKLSVDLGFDSRRGLKPAAKKPEHAELISVASLPKGDLKTEDDFVGDTHQFRRAA